jgi:hypothetical protein
MKFGTDRLLCGPEKAARRIMEHTRAFETIQDGRIYIEAINYPMVDKDKATQAEYWAGLQLANANGWSITPAEPLSGLNSRAASCSTDP